MDGTVFVSFHSTEQPQYDELVSPTLSACAEVGLVTESAATQDTDTVTLSDRNRTAVYDGNREVQLNFRIDDWDGPIDSVLNITTTANTLVSVDADPDDEYTGFARDLVDLIRILAVELDPIYVSTFNTHVEPTTPSPDTVLPFEFPLDLDRIPWLGVYSEPVIEHLGGREHVLETPAWNVEELENGNILIITTRTPWEGYHSELPADDHLLGDGRSRTGSDRRQICRTVRSVRRTERRRARRRRLRLPRRHPRRVP
ncbi:hypothetical protein [Natrinema versiforme]|uniref:hypothetical protein n=1 Tax=Natrinema versiforme TaxID=88724 RepID=UPI001EF9E31B|nr:hypothetical protein [Natrinema versiforme]